MLNKSLSLALILQATILSAVLFSKPDPVKPVVDTKATIVPEVETVVEEEQVEVLVENEPKNEASFNFVIPKRRVITELGSKGLISIDKEVNLMGTLGEAFMDNPLVKMSMEKRSRKMMRDFFADFIKEANLTPEEQLAFFQILGETMQANMRSFMSAMGENMELMKDMGSNGLVPELTKGIKENNVAMNEQLQQVWGDQRSSEFNAYHRNKSINSSMSRIDNQLKGDDKLSAEQASQVERILEDRYRNPFDEDSYNQSFNKMQDSDLPEGLNDKQRRVIRFSERKNNGLFLSFH